MGPLKYPTVSKATIEKDLDFWGNIHTEMVDQIDCMGYLPNVLFYQARAKIIGTWVEVLKAEYEAHQEILRRDEKSYYKEIEKEIEETECLIEEFLERQRRDKKAGLLEDPKLAIEIRSLFQFAASLKEKL